jgi:AcrR family transcriptional regulator
VRDLAADMRAPLLGVGGARVLPRAHFVRKSRSQADRTVATRSQVLITAIAVLHERGYPSASTLAIARRAGLSLGALQHHFPTKAALMAAVVEQFVRANTRIYRRTLVRTKGRDPIERLMAMLDASWTVVLRPEFAAVLEISLARRSDKELDRAVEPLFTRGELIARRITLTLARRAGFTDEVRIEQVRQFGATLLRGLALELASGLPQKEAKVIFDIWRANLLRLLEGKDG